VNAKWRRTKGTVGTQFVKARVESFGELHRALLGLGDGVTAEFVAGARNDAAHEGSGFWVELLHQRFFEKDRHAVFGHTREYEVLVDAQANVPVAVDVRESSRLDEFKADESTRRHYTAHVEQTFLYLRVYAHVIASVARRQ
jgi:hypothetical protein